MNPCPDGTSDVESKILIRIIPKERNLNEFRKNKTKNLLFSYYHPLEVGFVKLELVYNHRTCGKHF